ncbi:MAG: hypothetical protein A2864_01550 [Candidatus Woykebacteria bacterium RIFCSPHIGHO2_01_FULL_39_12]|uniref:Metallo-beta-lactamase domain-containing protein n=2 Tax=Candidatus Woykeibacteriota TaxID=1817899 RepID=A0A1G1WE73_9BACT|nr:MAG: hypothetical protein A2134_00385 [Candidatus Woykebacteria bacterium RBG_16_39_9b]OGY27191.1 MAG: hypothetical protein A2864_01550 [Candidatus Woykebacteria bacterium RIFCSPHIGHO2_01_FULL_39_12]
MKILFLGTSAGWPLPRLGCKCELCSSKDFKDIRTRTSILLNGTLLLDVGPDTYHHLVNIDSKKIKYAAITHEHPDHTSGLWDLGHIYNSKKITIIINPNTFKKIRNLFFPNEYKIIKVEKNEILKLNGLNLTLLPVKHTKDSSFGILIESRNKKIFYAPDFKSLPPLTKNKIKNANLLLIDGSELKIKTPTHISIEEGIKLAKSLKAKKTYFVHLGHRTLPYKELSTHVQSLGGKNFKLPYDGLEIEV